MNTPQQRTIFDIDARAERDRGLDRVKRANLDWLHTALAMLPSMAREVDELTGEEMRVWLLAHGLAQPSSPHAWGALTRTALMRGVISDTGRSRAMHLKKSHARRTPVWSFTR